MAIQNELSLAKLEKQYAEDTQAIEKVQEQMLAERPVLLDLADSHYQTNGTSPIRRVLEEMGIVKVKI